MYWQLRTSKKLDILNQNFIRQGVEIFPMMLSIRILESPSLVFGSNHEELLVLSPLEELKLQQPTHQNNQPSLKNGDRIGKP